ncbi:MAG: cytochrome c-type biogenesis CcmF C-terminal domain-containing protein, partial [Acidimicrobiia bacterium]
AWAAAGVMIAAAVAGLRGAAPLTTTGLGTFAIAGIVRQVAVATRGRRRATAERPLTALARVTTGNRRLYGGLVVHAGVVVLAVAFAMSSAFAAEREVILSQGESARLRGYEITYLGAERSTSARKTTESVRLLVERGGQRLGVYEPALTKFRGSAQTIGTPSVRTGLLDDVYLTLIASPDAGDDRAVVGVRVNPLVVWLWIGAGIMIAGSVFAGWPGGRNRTLPMSVDADDQQSAVPQPPTPVAVGAGVDPGPGAP